MAINKKIPKQQITLGSAYNRRRILQTWRRKAHLNEYIMMNTGLWPDIFVLIFYDMSRYWVHFSHGYGCRVLHSCESYRSNIFHKIGEAQIKRRLTTQRPVSLPFLHTALLSFSNPLSIISILYHIIGYQIISRHISWLLFIPPVLKNFWFGIVVCNTSPKPRLATSLQWYFKILCTIT